MVEKYSDDCNIEGTVCTVLVSKPISRACCSNNGGIHESIIDHCSQIIDLLCYSVHMGGGTHLESSLEIVHR